jgi:phage terminase large subunit
LIGIETNFTPYVHKQLDKMQYPYVYVRQIEDNFSKAVTTSFGFRTTSITRPVIIDELKRIVRDETSVFNDYLTLNEMLTFAMNERGTKEQALPGKHDDLVIALAIAYYIRSQQRTYKELTPQVKKKRGFDPLSTEDESKEGALVEW